MRWKHILLVPAAIGVAVALVAAAASPHLAAYAAAHPVAAQNGLPDPNEMMPEKSAAKAQEILAQAVQALGGDVDPAVRNQTCAGRYAQFEHSGGLGGFLQVRAYKEMPDKYRVEYDPKGTIVDLYAGDQGWSLDKGGVSELPADSLADYHEQLETDVNTILRYRRSDPALNFRYAGVDVVDLMEVDWVEITDHLDHTIRIAFNKKGLPVREEIIQRDPKYHQLVHRSTAFTSYHAIDGVETPFQVSRFRDQEQVSQFFYNECEYNTALPPDLFTRASLDTRYAEHGGKHKK